MVLLSEYDILNGDMGTGDEIYADIQISQLPCLPAVPATTVFSDHIGSEPIFGPKRSLMKSSQGFTGRPLRIYYQEDLHPTTMTKASKHFLL